MTVAERCILKTGQFWNFIYKYLGSDGCVGCVMKETILLKFDVQ